MQGLRKYTWNFNAFLKYLSLLSIKRMFNSTIFCTIACNIFCLSCHRTALWGRSTFLLSCQRKLRTHICGAFCVLFYVLILVQIFQMQVYTMAWNPGVQFDLRFSVCTVRIFTWTKWTPAIINEDLTTTSRELREAFWWPDVFPCRYLSICRHFHCRHLLGEPPVLHDPKCSWMCWYLCILAESMTIFSNSPSRCALWLMENGHVSQGECDWCGSCSGPTSHVAQTAGVCR